MKKNKHVVGCVGAPEGRHVGLAFTLFASLTLSACGGAGTGESSSSGSSATGSAGLGGTGVASLSWVSPTTNTDGSALDLGGFVIYRGTSVCCLHPVGYVASNETTYTANGLASGTHYFAITAYDASGVESLYSEIVQKAIN